MPSLGLTELLLVGIVILVVLGPERLPQAARKLGQVYAQFRRAADELQQALVLEADRQDEEERLQELRELRMKEAEAHEKAMQAAGEGTFHQPAPKPPEPAAEPDEDGPPPGFTEREWAEVPDHVKKIIRRREQES